MARDVEFQAHGAQLVGSTAEADANFVLSASGGIVEIQVTAEDVPIDHAGFEAMRMLATAGIAQLVAAQRLALEIEP